MIKSTFLQKQVDKSRRERRTTPFLRRLVFQIVDQGAKLHYTDTYPIRCLQCSYVIKYLLAKFAIKSQIFAGAVCFSEVFEDPDYMQWGGFWDKDHHIWLMSEFGELIDLSINVMYRHPRAKRTDGIPNPPIWWSDPSLWPPIIRYLPDMPVGVELEDATEAKDLATFQNLISELYESALESSNVENVNFDPILDGMDTLQSLTVKGHPWATKSFAFQRYNIPFPYWIQERERELIYCSMTGQPPSSRLASVPNLFQER